MPPQEDDQKRSFSDHDTFTKFVLALITALAISATTGVAVMWRQMAVLEVRLEERRREIDERIAGIASNKARDDSQDRQLKRMWELHNYERGRINILETKARIDPTSPPGSSDSQ